jgi:hypothetical protein
MKLKGRRFQTVEEIQAESQAALNTLGENDFHECFKKMAAPLGSLSSLRRELL